MVNEMDQMAMIMRGKSPCSICGEVLDDRITEPSWLSRHGMHFDCLVLWPNRRAFSEAYFKRSWLASGRWPRGAVIHDDDACRLVLFIGAAATRNAH